MAENKSPSADRLDSRLNVETLFAHLSSRLINRPHDVEDNEINDALRLICELLGIDLAVLWQWSGPDVISAVHYHSAQDVAPPAEPLSEERFAWTRAETLAGHTVNLRSADDLPPEAAADRESCRLLGIKSNLTLPLARGGAPPLGALGLSTRKTHREWPDALVQRLQLVAQFFTNVLARRRADDALRMSEHSLRVAADLAGLGFYVVDYGEAIAFFDARLRDLFGVPERVQESLQPVQFYLERVHPDDRQRFFEQAEQLIDGRLERVTIEYRYLHPDRGERWLHHVARVAARDAAGRTLKSYGVLRDITEQRQREEALRQSLGEIKRLKDRLQAESDYLKAEIKLVHPHGEVIGKSAAIKKVLHLVEQVAPTDSTVLIRGETGTGKELVAQSIHRFSRRGGRLMVTVNCAALPSGLIESELFGREKGAYTGALTRQIGRFQVADGSTVFLDEVGELSLEVQAKLLRVLETGEFERLGSPRVVTVDVRVIAATNRDLAEDVRQGRFREDLYYRLNVFPIRVPPLRERAEDVPLLAWAFLEEFSSRMGKKITKVPRRTMEALQLHSWPGNVRELRNVIEHAAIITQDETLRVPMLDESRAVAEPPRTLADSEREIILQALERARWRIKGPQGAAAQLGLNPSTLYGRMKKLGIRPPGTTESSSE